MKRLLAIIHAPSPNTQRLRAALVHGANHKDVEGVEIMCQSPFDTQPDDVLLADAVVLGTTENLGYMSGAMKDFFDRCYYPCLDKTDALPYALFVRAGLDGTGTCRAVASIASGIRWKPVRDPLVCKGEWQDAFVEQVEELGLTMAASLEAGIL